MKCALEECNNEARIRFCSNKCKDKFHNRHNPRGKFAHLHPKNRTRYSDADDLLDIEYLHPLSGEGLGQE